MSAPQTPLELRAIGRTGMGVGRVCFVGGVMLLIASSPLAFLFLTVGVVGLVGGKRELSRARHLEEHRRDTTEVFARVFD